MADGEIVQPDWTIGYEFIIDWENRNSVGDTAEGLECQGEENLFMQFTDVIKSVPWKH